MKYVGFAAAAVMVLVLVVALYALRRRRVDALRRSSVMKALVFVALCTVWGSNLAFSPIRADRAERVCLPDDSVIFGAWLLIAAFYLTFKHMLPLAVHCCGLVFYAACLGLASIGGASIEASKAAWLASVSCFAGTVLSYPVFMLTRVGVLTRRDNRNGNADRAENLAEGRHPR